MNQRSTRRKFIKYSGMSLAGLSMAGWPARAIADTPHSILSKSSTIQEVIDMIISYIPGGKLSKTVDTVKSGDPTQRVTGIATTFLATAEVIQQAADKNVNLIITHEPTYYNHYDETDWLKNDAVYQFKRRLLEDNGIVVWRFHDYWHLHQPDGILHGFLKQVGWEAYEDQDRENICVIPATTLGELARFFKEKLNLHRPFMTGDPDMKCRQIGLLLGAMGGRHHMRMLSTEDIEVLVVGETPEWETCEYVRDASFAGMQKGLIVLGHAVSEEPGMQWLVEWLQPKVAEVPVYHMPAKDPFRLV